MQLIETAIEGIQNVHSDMSVSQQDTLISLNTIRDEIDILIEAVESDLRTQEKDEIPF